MLADPAHIRRVVAAVAEGPIEPLPAWTLPPEQERRLMFDAVAHLLANVAAAGTLLVLNDLKWAGPDALDLLAALARTAAGARLRIIGAYRNTEVGPEHPLAVTLADLAHASLVAQRTLHPLTLPEAGQLLDSLLDRPGLEDLFVTHFLPVLAWAHLELGEMAAAEQVAAQAIRRTRADNLRLDLADALRVRAMIALRQEHWPEAEQSLEEGLALARRMPYPYAEARLLHAYGEMHAQKGEAEPARQRLEAGLAIFRRLGARKDAERMEQIIADCQQT